MKRKSFWISAGVLVVPVVIFYFLGSGVQNYKKLPILGVKIPPDGIHQKDTIYYSIPDFQVWDQTGKALTQASFNDRIYVANFFFASCKTDCATMNRRLSQVFEKYVEFTEVQFISFSMDPVNDSIPVLVNYAKKYKADPNIWHFVSVKNESLYPLQKGFLLPVSTVELAPNHYTQLILVDKQNRIRGVYDSDSEADVLQLQDDLKVLLYEYHQPGL